MLINMVNFMPPRDPGDDGQPKMGEREAMRRNPLLRHGHQLPKRSRRLHTETIVVIVGAVVIVAAAFILPVVF